MDVINDFGRHFVLGMWIAILILLLSGRLRNDEPHFFAFIFYFLEAITMIINSDKHEVESIITPRLLLGLKNKTNKPIIIPYIGIIALAITSNISSRSNFINLFPPSYCFFYSQNEVFQPPGYRPETENKKRLFPVGWKVFVVRRLVFLFSNCYRSKRIVDRVRFRQPQFKEY
jgi:hypothetical protein